MKKNDIKRYIISVVALLAVAVSLCSCRDDKDMPDASDFKKNLPGVWKFEGDVQMDGYESIVHATMFAKFDNMYGTKAPAQYFQSFRTSDGIEYYDLTPSAGWTGYWTISNTTNTDYGYEYEIPPYIRSDYDSLKGWYVGVRFHIQNITKKRMVTQMPMGAANHMINHSFNNLTFTFMRSTEKEMDEFITQTVANGKDVNPVPH